MVFVLNSRDKYFILFQNKHKHSWLNMLCSKIYIYIFNYSWLCTCIQKKWIDLYIKNQMCFTLYNIFVLQCIIVVVQQFKNFKKKLRPLLLFFFVIFHTAKISIFLSFSLIWWHRSFLVVLFRICRSLRSLYPLQHFHHLAYYV